MKSFRDDLNRALEIYVGRDINAHTVTDVARTIIEVADRHGIPLLLDKEYEEDLMEVKDALESTEITYSFDEVLKLLDVNIPIEKEFYLVKLLPNGTTKYLHVLNSGNNIIDNKIHASGHHSVHWYDDPSGITAMDKMTVMLVFCWLHFLQPLQPEEGVYKMVQLVSKGPRKCAMFVRKHKEDRSLDNYEYYHAIGLGWKWTKNRDLMTALPVERATNLLTEFRSIPNSEYQYYVITVTYNATTSDEK